MPASQYSPCLQSPSAAQPGAFATQPPLIGWQDKPAGHDSSEVQTQTFRRGSHSSPCRHSPVDTQACPAPNPHGCCGAPPDPEAQEASRHAQSNAGQRDGMVR